MHQTKTFIANGNSMQSVLALLRKAGIFLHADCAGRGTCGKCRVRFAAGAPAATEAELARIPADLIADGWRLACRACPAGAFEVEYALPEEEIAAESVAVGGAGGAGAAGAADGAGAAAGGGAHLRAAGIGTTTGTPPHRAIAVDIGTTTIAAALVDTATGAVLDTRTGVNHQRAFGADVISRIQAANDGSGAVLKRLIDDDLSALILGLGEDPERIPIVLTGNTTMQHLSEGLSCLTLGAAPFSPVDISLHSVGNRLYLPGISTFVGADIVAGIAALGMDASEDLCVLVDLGTNGEMAIGRRGKILSASTAAGPAFEGGCISCGVAGVPGAICRVEMTGRAKTAGTDANRAAHATDTERADIAAVDAARAAAQRAARTCDIRYETIGGAAPVGLCGTGVLEITYELLKNGIVDETGLMDDRYADSGFPVAGGVTFTGRDIREVQLAKAAIRAGLETLIEAYGASYDEISRVYLAGGFGRGIDLKKAAGIGLIPEELVTKTEAVGNSALQGAVLAACDAGFRRRLVGAVGISEEISLSDSARFSELFIDCMFLCKQL